VLLATEARSVIQDRVKGRRPRRATILQFVALVCLALGYFGFQSFQSFYTNHFNAQHEAQAKKVAAPYQRELKAVEPSNHTLLNEATTALAKHNISSELGFLLEQQIIQLRQDVIFANENQTPVIADPAVPPSWSRSFWLAVAVAVAFAGIVTGIGYLVLPSDESVFLIGGEKRGQQRLSIRRERITWSIIVAFLVGVAASLVSSLG
jgi:hypothetical protein